jgi:hypothetical protein
VDVFELLSSHFKSDIHAVSKASSSLPVFSATSLRLYPISPHIKYLSQRQRNLELLVNRHVPTSCAACNLLACVQVATASRIKDTPTLSFYPLSLVIGPHDSQFNIRHPLFLQWLLATCYLGTLGLCYDHCWWFEYEFLLVAFERAPVLAFLRSHK